MPPAGSLLAGGFGGAGAVAVRVAGVPAVPAGGDDRPCAVRAGARGFVFAGTVAGRDESWINGMNTLNKIIRGFTSRRWRRGVEYS